MENMTFNVKFNITGLAGSMYALIPGLENAMIQELVRVYDMFANESNSGITEYLNQDFESRYGKQFGTDLYDWFIADGYNRMIINKYNTDCVSPLLDFYMDANDMQFTGVLKADHSIKINFYLVRAE